MSNNNKLQSALTELEKSNNSARKLIAEMKKKIAQRDFELQKLKLKSDIAALKSAKKILEEKKGD